MQLWADLTGPQLPWCRLRVLLEHLPTDSAYFAATNPAGSADWGLGEQLLAEVVHTLEWQIWLNADSKKRGPAPVRPPMPWDPEGPPTRSTLTPAEMEQRLLAQRAEAQARHVEAPAPQ